MEESCREGDGNDYFSPGQRKSGGEDGNEGHFAGLLYFIEVDDRLLLLMSPESGLTAVAERAASYEIVRDRWIERGID